jgi:hypothetical protein
MANDTTSQYDDRLLIHASTIEHVLKNAFIHAPPRLIRMQMDQASIGFTVSFAKDEIFLKQLFSDALFASGIKYEQIKDQHRNIAITCKVDDHHNKVEFLETLETTIKEFAQKITCHKNVSAPALSANRNLFFGKNDRVLESKPTPYTPQL